MFGACMWYVQRRMEPDIVGTDVVSALQETCIKVLDVFDRMLFCENTKTEYVVIRWYNDCKALVLFTGWEPFCISLFWGKGGSNGCCIRDFGYDWGYFGAGYHAGNKTEKSEKREE